MSGTHVNYETCGDILVDIYVKDWFTYVDELIFPFQNVHMFLNNKETFGRNISHVNKPTQDIFLEIFLDPRRKLFYFICLIGIIIFTKNHGIGIFCSSCCKRI